MPKSKVRFAGLDVHEDSIVITVANLGRNVARDAGTFPSDWVSLEKQRLPVGHQLPMCYEPGLTEFALHRQLTENVF